MYPKENMDVYYNRCINKNMKNQTTMRRKKKKNIQKRNKKSVYGWEAN